MLMNMNVRFNGIFADNYDNREKLIFMHHLGIYF